MYGPRHRLVANVLKQFWILFLSHSSPEALLSWPAGRWHIPFQVSPIQWMWEQYLHLNSSTGCGDSALDTQFYLSLGQRAGQTGCCYFHHKLSPDLRPEVELLCSHSPSCCSRLADWDWLEGSLVDPGRDNSLYNILQHCRTAQGNWAQSQPIQAANSSITRSRVHCYC